MAVKILAASDLHLGRSSSEVPLTEKESSTRYTWERMVEWCIDHRADALLLAGDIVDRENRYFEAVGPLQAGFRKLDEAGIAVLMIAGNHDFDVLPSIVKGNTYNNVHLLGKNGQWEVKHITLGGQIVQFTGWSFTDRYVRESPLHTFDDTVLDPNLTTIGIFHGDAFNREGKYGPFDISNLSTKTADAWIVGHIHKPQTLREYNPGIYYPGSPHALSPGETGIHGALLLTIGHPHEIETKQIHLSPVRYETLKVDITGAKDGSEIREKVTSSVASQAIDIFKESEKSRFLVTDILLEGRHASVSELDAWMINLPDSRPETGTPMEVIPRKVIINVEPEVENLAELAKQPTPAGILAQTILAIQNGRPTEFLLNLRKQWYREHEQLVTSPTYQPLLLSRSIKQPHDHDADSSLLKECNRLLGELLRQQAKMNGA